MIKRNYWIFVVLTLIAVYTFFIRYYHFSRFDYPLAFDPYFFLAISERLVNEGIYRPEVPYSILHVPLYYPPLLPIFLAGIAKIFSLGLVKLYIYFGPLTASLLPFIIYLATRQIFKPITALAIAGIYPLIPYVMSRTILTLPENIAVLIFWLIIYFFLKNNDKKWNAKNITIVIILFLIMLGFHFSALYLLPVVFIWLVLNKKFLPNLWIILILTGVILLIYLVSPVLQNMFSLIVDAVRSIRFTWNPPSWEILLQNFRAFNLILGILGFIFFIFNWKRFKTGRNFFIALLVPFLFLLFFYGKQGPSLGEITADRFFIYTAIPLVFLIGYFLESLKNRWLLGGSLTAILIFSFTPAWSRAWEQAYRPDEIQAVQWLKNNTAQESVIITQPIMEWPIMALAQRKVYWDVYNTEPLIGQKIDKILLGSEKFNQYPAYIFYSRTKNQREVSTVWSDGKIRKTGFSVYLTQYGLDEKKFEIFPIIFENQNVIIYKLNLKQWKRFFS